MSTRTPTNPAGVTTGNRTPGPASRRAVGRHLWAPGGLGGRLAATARAVCRALRPRPAAHRRASADPADSWAAVIVAALRAGHDVVLLLPAVTA
jgi:hypothetical protein